MKTKKKIVKNVTLRYAHHFLKGCILEVCAGEPILGNNKKVLCLHSLRQKIDVSSAHQKTIEIETLVANNKCQISESYTVSHDI